MLSFIILIIVALLPFLTIWITSPQEIFINDENLKKERLIFKKRTSWKLTKKGWLFLGISALTIFLAWYQYQENIKNSNKFQGQLVLRDSINRDELRVRDLQYRNMQSFRDSLAGIKIEKGKNETILALAKYSLKYDSSQMIIQRIIRDSSKTNVIVPENPVFYPCAGNEIEYKDSIANTYQFVVNFCSDIAASTNHNIFIYVGYLNSLTDGKFHYFLKNQAVANETIIKKDGGVGSYFWIPKFDWSGLIVVLVKGKYTNIDGTKEFYLNTLYYYNMKSKKSGILKGNTEKNLKTFFKQHE